ncbi:alpha-N-acetylglucosaminidase-like isoform X2 [Babylonia areolata]|uniref:alpha-N-acetylglucosaminidase-like isoform X2 n=1 Tax=Babylonia areolata TaxID=304850 RepID=UPI003FD21E4B
MKQVMSLLILLLSTSVIMVSAVEFEALNRLRSKSPASVQADTVSAMIQRVVGDRASEFVILVSSELSTTGNDAFRIHSVGSRLEITGTTGVAAAMGFYYYLKTYCDSQFTWGGEHIHLPSPLPPVSSPVVINVLDRFRYYQNVCTVSYSSVFWNWTRWERHLDWMAMNGINLPLAFTGQEAIFQRLYMEMGFSNEDMNEFFGGPAFLAWSRMGNIQGWGGPLPQSWIIKKLLLQHQILRRMRDFGMIPVLPGFAGHVPPAFIRLFPFAKVTRLGNWAGFNSTYSATYLLDFDDPLFEIIGSKFIQLMQSEFGVDHVYNADTFNEMRPASNSTEYLASAGRAVYNAMRNADPDAVWLMQGWLFIDSGFWKGPQINALVNSVPKGRMIILDLMSEMSPIFLRSQSYYGQPFIWCMLHNFGGTMELYGALDNVNEGPTYGRHFMANSTMVGLGLTMEGIFQNEVMYEFMMENAWTPQPRNITAWISAYPKKRYGFTSPEIDQAWQLLKWSVYSCRTGHQDFDGVLVTRRPRIDFNILSDLWYDPNQLLKAWDNLLLGADQFSPNSLFLYDLVDVTRNSLQIVSLMYYTELIGAYNENNTLGVQKMGEKMVDLLSDMDTLLASDPHFLLGRWISDAVSYASDMGESFLLQNNARNQITIWGPRGEIVDYASKQWAGLFKDYYVPRWKFFADWMVQAIKNNMSFDAGKFNQQILQQVELPFTLALDLPPTEPSGDSVAIVKELHTKYRQEFSPDILRKLAMAASKAHKQQRPASPLSWKRGGQHQSSDSELEENIIIEKENAEWLGFLARKRHNHVFEEVGYEKKVVVV